MGYTSTMRSEILFIVVLIAPWALVLMAVLLYRRRRMRKGMDDSKVGWRDGGGHAG